MTVRREPARPGNAHAIPSRKNAHTRGTMCWRQVSKLQKTVLLVLFYLTVYLLISYALAPETRMTFVRDELRVGDKYAFIYVVAPFVRAFTDSEGADVFKGCGRCFITNNKGFLPMSEYDAILIHGNRSLLTETAAFMDPGKRYLLETTKRCLSSKFRRCERKPKITSFSTRDTFDLCSLCLRLHRRSL